MHAEVVNRKSARSSAWGKTQAACHCALSDFDRWQGDVCIFPLLKLRNILFGSNQQTL